MRYILMIHVPRGTGAYQHTEWPPGTFQAHMEYMRQVNRELLDRGELVDVEGLSEPNQAQVVQVGPGGIQLVTDGPFPETKEFLAGYWIVEVEGPERARAIAAKISAAPGPAGEPLGLPIELRRATDLRHNV